MATPITTRPDSAPEVPPLRHGDRMSRAEFERRYDAMPELKKAELIEGVVYMPPAAVRFSHHGSPHAEMMGWLYFYRAFTPGTRIADNSSVRLESDSMPQPDGILMIEPACGGQARISLDDYVEDGMELAAEIAASSKDIDLGLKFQLYRRCKVREYIVWRVDERAIDWFVLRQDQYVRLARAADGTYRSEVFPGLWLDPNTLIQSDPGKLVEILQKGIATPEHAAFVAQLQRARTPS